MSDPTNPDQHDVGGAEVGDDERGSEVSDYTGEVPRIDASHVNAEAAGRQPSGFGDGDVADVDIDGQSTEPTSVDGADTAEIDTDLSPEEIVALTAERDQYRDAAIRLQADFENFRRRANAQTAADVDRATGRMAEALLPVLDAAETAYVSHPDEVGPLFNALLGELRKQGLETFDLSGKAFDPEVADAVAHEPGTGGDVTVAEVLRSGYSWKGKTLRPAMVRTTD